MKPVLLFALALLIPCAPPPAGNDDYELAQALAERGWYDLAEELFSNIANAPGLSPEKKAEGRYGIARLKITMAERAPSADEKITLYDEAIAGVNNFLKKFADHPRRGEALADIGYLHQSKGKVLMGLAKADPSRLKQAEQAFAASEKLFTELIAKLKKKELKPDAKGYDKWEMDFMQAKYNYAVSLFAHAETYKGNSSKHAEMHKLLDKMIKYLNDDFIWYYEQYVLCFDVFTYIGRAYQLLAETSEVSKASEYWRKCSANIGKARSLLSDRKNRAMPAVQEVATRASYFETKACIAYGDTRRGPEATRQYNKAYRVGEDLFRLLPSARELNMGKAIRLEQGRALCKAGKVEKGINLLKELSRKYKDSWVENMAIDLLGEFGGALSVSYAIDAADNYFERGTTFHYRAMQMYRKALAAIKKPEDKKYVPYCWHRIGQCYYYLNRWYEAAVALSIFEKPPLVTSEEAPQAAIRKRDALAKIYKMTGNPADERILKQHRTWLISTFPKEAGKQEIRNIAIDMEVNKEYLKAVEQWRKLATPGSETFEEATFSIGFNLYREGDNLAKEALKKSGPERDEGMKKAMELWKQSQESFKQHLDHVEKLTSKDPKIMKNAIGSILFSCKILVHPRIDQAQAALDLSENLNKRFPSADPKFSIAILALRIDAKLKLGQVQAAEKDLMDLKSLYKKYSIGSRYYSRALALLANAFETAANELKEKNPEDYERLADKAGNYYFEWYNLNPDEVAGDPKKMEAMAEKLFFVAESRRSKNDTEGAKEIFDRARGLYSDYLIRNERSLLKQEDGQGLIRAIEQRITHCYLMTGRYDEARQKYELATKDDIGMRNGSAWEGLADCYVHQAKSLPTGAERLELIKQADGIYARLAVALSESNQLDEHYWRLLYKHAECYMLQEDYLNLQRFFSSYDLRGIAPKWDDNQWKFQEKFEALRKKLNEKAPGRKTKEENP